MLLVETYLAPSTIHGIGLFAAKPIRKNDMVWVLDTRVDQLLTDAEIEVLEPVSREQVRKYSYWSRSLEKHVLCADDGRFFNHADVPNCVDVETPVCNVTVAVQDIAAGEEITCDYAILDGRHERFSVEPHDWRRVLLGIVKRRFHSIRRR